MSAGTKQRSSDICRICLNSEGDANLSDIFDFPNVPMEILSIGCVEVSFFDRRLSQSQRLCTTFPLQIFQSDEFKKICECCKTIVGNAYKFKQICRESDYKLKKLSRDDDLPTRITIPQEMLPARAQPEAKKEVKLATIGVGCDAKDITESSTQTDAAPDFAQFEIVSEEIIPPPPIFALQEEEEEESEIILELKEEPKKRETIKILNKSSASSPPKQFKKPSQTKIERVAFERPTILNSHLKGSKFEEIETLEENIEENIQIVAFNEEYLDEASVEMKVPNDVSDDGIVYTCDVCERSFPLLQQLEIHRKNHTRERNHPCDSCDKSFFTKYDLAKHVLIHTKQKDYVCIVCSKSFSRSTLLYRHEKIHTDPKIPRYACNNCDRIYLNKLDYDKHVQTHMKNRPFACEHCDKSFAFKQGLERHEVIHDNSSQPHACEYCDLRFPSDARLQRHLSSQHAGDRPFPCSKCTKRFMLSHHLYRHMRTSHQVDDISYQCPECNEEYSNRKQFFSHCLVHSTNMLACPLCKIAFDSSDEANDHVELHSTSDMYFCDYCNLIYMSQKDLHEHFDDQHSNELCSIGEEVEYIVEDRMKSKRKTNDGPVKSGSKRAKSDLIIYEEAAENEQLIEFVTPEDEYMVSEIDGAAFVEYDEVDACFDLPSKVDSPKKTLETTRKSYSRVAAKKQLPASPVKTPPKLPTVERLKMSKAKIEQLKKEGKIKVVNGELRMKT